MAATGGPKTCFKGKMVSRSCYLKRFVFGNAAQYLDEAEERMNGHNHTHKWTIYVRPFRSEDMSAYVKKVVFLFHESYENPCRTLEFPPYEVTETGWGEFEIGIEVYLKGSVEGPLVFKHGLVLPGFNGRPLDHVVSESYAQVLFKNEICLSPRAIVFGSWGHQSSKIDKIEKWVVDDVLKKERK